MIKKISKYFQDNGIVLCLLLVGYLVNPYNLGFILGYPIVALVLIKKKFLLKNLDFDVFLLLIFSLTYAGFYAFNPTGGFQYIAIYAVFPPVFYLLGKLLFKILPSREDTIYLLFFLSFLFFFFSFDYGSSQLFYRRFWTIG